MLFHIFAVAMVAITGASSIQQPLNIGSNEIPDLFSLSIAQLSSALWQGHYTSVDLTRAYLARIEATHLLNAVLSINSYALVEAANADIQIARLRRERHGHLRVPLLLGIPYIVKDNRAVPPHVGPTTAGSFALLNTTVKRASSVVQHLTDAGAVLLGISNLDEFAYAKGKAPWGFSTRGGQIDSPFYHGGDVCGSSGGSAVVTTLGLAAFTLGTQTGLSIICPSSKAGIVGLKPGLGRLKMDGIIPISSHLDSVGPMTRTVEDAILVFHVLAGESSGVLNVNDEVSLTNFSLSAPLSSWRIGVPHDNFWTKLNETSPGAPGVLNVNDEVSLTNFSLYAPLSSWRIGVPHDDFWTKLNETSPGAQEITQSLEQLLHQLISDSVMFVDADLPDLQRFRNDVSEARDIVVSHDLVLGLQGYLSGLAQNGGLQTVADIVSWQRAHASISLPPGPLPPSGHPLRDPLWAYADQSTLERSASFLQVGPQNISYRPAVHNMQRLAWDETVEPYLEENLLDLIIAPSDSYAAEVAAMAGLPMLTVPLGYIREGKVKLNATWPFSSFPGIPYGVSLIGRKNDEHKLLQFGAIIESFTQAHEGHKGRWRRVRGDIKEKLQGVEDL